MSKSKDIEIEIQVRVGDVDKLISFLNKKGEFVAEKKQVDEYFSPKHRDFIKKRPIAEWLRLRESDKDSSITYKYWHFDKDGKSSYCDEFETTIDELKQLKKIFQTLDFTPLVTVSKERMVWTYKDYEISVDAVKDLGDFVEIEYQGKDTKIKSEKITDAMVKFLKKVGVGKIERNYLGYPFQLLFPDEVKWETL